MKFKIFPKGYDPIVAAGSPSKDAIAANCNWMEADTFRCLEIERNASIVEVDDEKQLPTGLWHECQDIPKSKECQEKKEKQYQELKAKLGIHILK